MKLILFFYCTIDNITDGRREENYEGSRCGVQGP